MAQLKGIWLKTYCDGAYTSYELRIDWDNDRHQAINLESLMPGDVKKGLRFASQLLAEEQRRGNL